MHASSKFLEFTPYRGRIRSRLIPKQSVKIQGKRPNLLETKPPIPNPSEIKQKTKKKQK